jgi:hypothetical protein
MWLQDAGNSNAFALAGNNWGHRRAAGNTGEVRTLPRQFSEETTMRRTIPLLASLATLAAIAFSAQAQAQVQAQVQAQIQAPIQVRANERYCLQGRQWGYPGNCLFVTYQQCQATASGTDAYCDINPRYAFQLQQQQQMQMQRRGRLAY